MKSRIFWSFECCCWSYVLLTFVLFSARGMLVERSWFSSRKKQLTIYVYIRLFCSAPFIFLLSHWPKNVGTKSQWTNVLCSQTRNSRARTARFVYCLYSISFSCQRPFFRTFYISPRSGLPKNKRRLASCVRLEMNDWKRPCFLLSPSGLTIWSLLLQKRLRNWKWRSVICIQCRNAATKWLCLFLLSPPSICPPCSYGYYIQAVLGNYCDCNSYRYLSRTHSTRSSITYIVTL
jgi:hypothetical protein